MKLSKLEDQHQPQLAAPDGTTIPGQTSALQPPPTPASMAGPDPMAGPMPAAGPEAMLAGAGGIGPRPALSEDDQDDLLDAPATPAELEMLPTLAAALAEAVKDDELPEPALLKASDQDILNLILGRLETSASARQPFEKRWLRGWKDWNQYLEGTADSWRSKVFIPIVYQHVAAAIPPQVAAIFDSGPIWDARATKKEHEGHARAVSQTSDHFMRNKAPSDQRFYDMSWSACIFGTGFLRMDWRKDYRPVATAAAVKLKIREGEEGQYVATRRSVKEPDDVGHPVMHAVDIWNAFPCPKPTSEDEIPWYIERLEPTVGEVLGLVADGHLDEAKVTEWLQKKPWHNDATLSGGPANVGMTKDDALSAVGLAPRSNGAESTTSDIDVENNHLVMFMMMTDTAVVFANEDVSMVLGKGTNRHNHQRVPVVPHQFERIPGSIWGRGIGDILAGIQAQVNFNYNKGNDVVQLGINSPLLVRSAGNSIAQGQVAWQPGAHIFCRDPNSDVKPLDFKDPMPTVLRLEEHLLAHGDRATGVNDMVRGMSPAGANTATEFAGLQSQTRIRMSQHVRALKVMLGKVGRLLLSMIQQYVDKPFIVRLLGSKGFEYIELSPAEIHGDFDLVPNANATRSNPALMRSDVVALLPWAAANPLIDQEKLSRYVLRTFEVPDADEMIMPPPPPPQDPAIEEIALDVGADVMPSPDENFEQHLSVHQMELQNTDPASRPIAYQARKKHLEKTMMMMQQVYAAQALGVAQSGALPPGGAPGGGAPPPAREGGTEARRGATRLGEAQGSSGPPGRAPGPAGAPNRK